MSFAHTLHTAAAPPRRRHLAWIAAGVFATALLGGLVVIARYS
jgi:hypothetical protein